jgi:hypothetical protein
MDSGKNIRVEQALKELFKLKNDVETDLRLIKVDAFSGEFADFPGQLAPASSVCFRTRPGPWNVFCRESMRWWPRRPLRVKR